MIQPQMIQPQEITNNPRQDVDDEVRAQLMDFGAETNYLTIMEYDDDDNMEYDDDDNDNDDD